MALTDIFGGASSTGAGAGVASSVVNGAVNLALSAQKYEQDRKNREAEVARLERREDSQYTRAVRDLLSVGYDARVAQTPPSPSSSQSVAPVQAPDFATDLSAGITSGLGVGKQEADFQQRQRELDQIQENNEWGVTGNMFQNMRQSIDDDNALAQNDMQYYHGRYVELKKFISAEMEIGDENAKRSFDEYEDAWEKKKKELLSKRHNFEVSLSAGNQSSNGTGSEHGTSSKSESSEKNSETDNVNAFTGEVVGETIGHSSSSTDASSIADKVTDIAKKAVSLGAKASYGYQHLTKDEKEELDKWSHKWLSENLSKDSKKFKSLTEEDKQAIVKVITETYANYIGAENYRTSIRDKKRELYRQIEEQYNSHQSNRYRSPRGSSVYLQKDVDMY